MSEQEVINKKVEPLPVLVYGRSDCEDTALLRHWLQEYRISFVEINVEQDEQAAEYVRAVNNGELVTPTIVFGERAFLLVKPDRKTLNDALRRAGYRPSTGSEQV